MQMEPRAAEQGSSPNLEAAVATAVAVCNSHSIPLTLLCALSRKE